jgi:hypothetical protein
MKIRSTIHWPEGNMAANQIGELPDDEATARINAGFAVEHVETEAPAETEQSAA